MLANFRFYKIPSGAEQVFFALVYTSIFEKRVSKIINSFYYLAI